MTQSLLSIGMPVYNAGRYLSGALDSLLAQDFASFDLLISDNASTDDTEAIGRRYAAKDSRVRYCRNESNIGAAENFNKVFEESPPRKYFMWAAHDDLWDPTYIGRCIEVLEERPEVLLCTSEIEFIDASGRAVPLEDIPREIRDYNRLHTQGLDQRARARTLTERINWYAVYGVIRREALQRTGLFRGIYGGDIMALLELLLQGETVSLPAKLFRYRMEEKSAAVQVESLSGRQSSTAPATIYTQLASHLLDTLGDAGPELREDLLSNVAQGVWGEQIVNENALQRYKDPELLKTQIRLLVDRRMNTWQSLALQMSAAGRYVQNQQLVKRMKVRTKLILDALGVRRWTFHKL